MKNKTCILLLIFVILGCQDKQHRQTILEGKADIYVDESLAPIVRDEADVFESTYDAHLRIIPETEAEILNDLMSGKSAIAVLSRRLSDEERKFFERRKIIPRTTPFATDGIALIRNNSDRDTLVDMADIVSLLQGKSLRIKGLVFDNPNSGAARQLSAIAGVSTFPATVYAMGSNRKTIEYISTHPEMVGVVGLNWLDQPAPDMEAMLSKINILSLKAPDGKYYAPTQNNIAEGKYPLARELVVVDCQGFSGLGMGFASFAAGERGQRIVLKSGLLPAKIPGRKIVIRNTINKP